MLRGQWATNLLGLEHRLFNQLDEQVGTDSAALNLKGDQNNRAKKVSEAPQPRRVGGSMPREELLAVEGFPV